MSVPTNLTEITLPGDDEPTPIPTAPELSCTVCGTELEYSGRGRKPTKCDEHKRSTNTAASRGVSGGGKGGVGRAVDSIDQAYSLMVLGLTMLQLTESASVLAGSQAGLKEQNRMFLEQDPDLVKSINKAGAAGGRVGFFAAQIMTLGPVAVVVVGELKERREARDTGPE